jgi:hypothetical protein
MKDVGTYIYLFYDRLVYFTALWYILWPFGIFYGNLVYFIVIWYIVSCFGMLYQERSGSPVADSSTAFLKA